MTRLLSPFQSQFLLLAALVPSMAVGQESAPEIHPSACVPLEIDSERLACYDRALDRQATDPRQADDAALQARQTQDEIEQYQRIGREALPPRERARRAVGDLFRLDEGLPSLEDDVANAGKGGLLDSRWELAKDSKLGLFNFRAHRPVYLMPAFWSSAPNELPRSSRPGVPAERQSLSDVEAKFQLSFKTKALQNLFGDNGDIWMGYTQSSRWQVYNSDASRPFRESNHEPEVLLVFRTSYGLGEWRGRMLGVGINHQSNGRADPLSRSWNRVIANVGFDRENWALMIRPWWRLPDGSKDENPGIEDYIGRGDATLVYHRDGHELALAARHSLRSGDHSRGAVQLDWGFPLGLPNQTLRGHVQVFDGYGESLIDYDHRSTSIGLGISLMEWF